MAIVSIRLKRGLKANLPRLGAPIGEPFFCYDTKELFIGTGYITEAQFQAGVNPWSSIVTGKQIGRASCRERVLRLV